MQPQGKLVGHGCLKCVSCERIIMQCRCIEGHRNVVWGLCETCAPNVTPPNYHHMLAEHEGLNLPEARHCPVMAPIREEVKTTNWEAMAKALWGLLDDIDTLDDACMEDDARFRKLVRHIQHRRHEYLVSRDGQTLELP